MHRVHCFSLIAVWVAYKKYMTFLMLYTCKYRLEQNSCVILVHSRDLCVVVK